MIVRMVARMIEALLIGAGFSMALGAPATALAQESITLYGAGSLREAMTEIAAGFTASQGTKVALQFGASGRMRERIEGGDKVDIFTSADLGHARKLVDDGRASVLIMFAQNALCLLAPPRAGKIDSNSALDALLKEGGGRIAVSTPKIDPLGDYTASLFVQADRIKPGATARLQSRALVLDNPPGSPPARSGDYFLDALTDGRADLGIVYCSSRGRYATLAPDATLVAFPEALRVGPQNGLAVLKGAKPEAMLLALRILSPQGQQILAKHGFLAVALPGNP